MPTAQELLDSIPDLQKAADAAALVALEDHEDKKVRKAVRKALHVLRSRGVAIPEKGAKTWSAGGLEELRGDLEPRALIDVRSSPGVTRLVLAESHPESGGRLFVALVGYDGRVLQFEAFSQTDGQRNRMIRDWSRGFEGRFAPADYVRSRIRWSRDKTLALGHAVPAKLDEFLSELGDSPAERPVSPFPGLLAEIDPAERPAGELLAEAGAQGWPLMFDGDELFRRIGEASEGQSEEAVAAKSDEERLDMIRDAATGDAAIQEALKGSVSFALEDAAASLWLEGQGGDARALLDMVAEVRAADAPEAVGWAGEFVRMQVATVAMQQLSQMQQQQA